MSAAKRIQEYQQLVEQERPRPRYLRNLVAAFLVGGGFSLLGQIIMNYSRQNLQLGLEEAGSVTSIAMILISALLTGLGIYDNIGQFGGAGSAVPITGFANSVVSAGIEFKREGFILGLGAKLFVVAGPVIVYGSISAFLLGVIRLMFIWMGGR